MKIIKLQQVLVFLFTTTLIFAQGNNKWGDQNDGTYCNPVLPGDYSDLDAIRVDSDYYAISSTFQFSPGVVMLHSKDLVNWEILSHVVSDITVISPELNWDKMNRYGRGIWAGSLRYYKNKFWVYFGTPDEGFFMCSATSAAGPWEPLQSFWKVSGWDDCCTFCDDDGQLYFIATNFANNYNIHLFKMNPDGKSLIMSSDTIIHQSSGSEANKLYKINGMYYHFYSESKSEGRVCMMERSKSIYGPYEMKQLNHCSKNIDREPNQGGLIQTLSGDWQFFTHHGSGGFWEGRVASLLPVTWVEGWPIIGKVGTDGIGNMVWSAKMPIISSPKLFIQTNDEFDKDKLSVQWEWNYQPRAEKWSLTDRSGFLRLDAFKPIVSNNKLLFRVGNILTQRSMRTGNCEVITKIAIGGMNNGQFAGLCHYADTYSSFGVKQIGGIRKMFFDNNGAQTEGKVIADTILYLRTTWGMDGNSQYSFSIDGQVFESFGATYKLTWGNYRGDRIGIFTYNASVESGYIDVDWFHYNTINPPVINIIPSNPGTLNLTHQWTFDDGTANDVVGNCHGILKGGATIENKALKTSALGQYLELPATNLDIASYPSLSMEIWFTSFPGSNSGNTMLCYFGNTVSNNGSNGCFISAARADNVSRTAVSCGNDAAPYNSENGVNGNEYDDGLLHQMVSVISGTNISFYIDGVFLGSTALSSGNSIANISKNFAYLAKSGYSNDPTWIGSIDKFSLYNKELSTGEVLYLYQNVNITDIKKTKTDKIYIYPNPAMNDISISGILGNASAEIIDLKGRVLLFIRNVISNQKIGLENLSCGSYFMKISTQNETEIKNFLHE